MQHLSNEFTRLNQLLQADKSIMSDGCRALVLQDFAEKFNEYFEERVQVRMEITCKNGVYTTTIVFEAERIKQFNVLK